MDNSEIWKQEYIQYNSMDNYAILLQQFHIHEQQHAVTHQEFAQIIDYIRNQKQSKQSLIIRKKQQKSKFTHKYNRSQQNNSACTPKANVRIENHEKVQNLQEINNVILRKEHDELQKQVSKIRKVVKEMEDQLAVFIRKDNEIKQLKYSSKRQLQNAQLEVKNQKLLNGQIQQKYERMLQQLNLQKSNLDHENRFLADQLKQMKFITNNYKSGLISELSMLRFQSYKIQEIYTKKELENNLRSLYVIYTMKKNWENAGENKSYTELKIQAYRYLHPAEYFYFCSKKQLLLFYLKKFNYDCFKPLTMIVIEFYRSIMNSTSKLENIGNHLNTKLIQLKCEFNKLCDFIKNLQEDTQKMTINLIYQMDRQLFAERESINSRCRSVFQIIEREFKLVERLKRVTLTLDMLLDSKSELKPQNKWFNTTNSFNFNKKLELLLCKERKQPSATGSSLNISHDGTTSKINNFSTNKCISFMKKGSNQFSKSIFGKSEEQLCSFQILLYRNPFQVITQWCNVIKNGKQGLNFMETLLSNDLYRIFFQPYDYQPAKSQLQNEAQCYQKSFACVFRILQLLKKGLIQLIKNIVKECVQLSEKNKNLIFQSSAANQTRYVIQSKGYFRRDNFKLIQKLELMELKKQGLYIPFRYGIDIEQEMNNDRQISRQSKQISIDKIKNFSLRKPRYTAPDGPNYISTYRERLNKANRKIRDLLTNADNLRVKMKVKKQLSSSHCKKNTQMSIIL